MATTQQSKYDYNEVLEFIPNEYSSALQTVQEDLKNLRLAVERCEELYHGTSKGLSDLYKNLYQQIGYSNAADGVDIRGLCIWKHVNTIAAGGNILYTMALTDKETDESGGNAMTLN